MNVSNRPYLAFDHVLDALATSECMSVLCQFRIRAAAGSCHLQPTLGAVRSCRSAVILAEGTAIKGIPASIFSANVPQLTIPPGCHTIQRSAGDLFSNIGPQGR